VLIRLDVTAASALQLRPCSSEALGLLGTLTRCCSWMPCLLVTLARTCRTARCGRRAGRGVRAAGRWGWRGCTDLL